MQVKLLQTYCCGYKYTVMSHELGLITKGDITINEYKFNFLV